MFFPPMLLETAKTVFSSSDYIFETKYDGIRLIYSNVTEPILYTRNKGIATKQFPELLPNLPPDTVLDGEAMVFDPLGRDDFEGIKKRFFMRKDEKIKQSVISHPVTYMVFDILYHEGKDLRNLPLMERKEILFDLISDSRTISKVSFIETNGEELFQKARKNNLEGIVAKGKNSTYIGRRSSNWLKIINWIETTAIITGYRKSDHALVCCHEDLSPLGIVLTGMTPVHREAFFKIAKTIIKGEDRDNFYLEAHLKCRLKGRGFTSKGILRSPQFIDFIL